MRAYYDRRASEYDDWYESRGFWRDVDRPRWNDELDALERVLGRLSPARTLDVACGTGYLSRWLPGELVALDQSKRMLDVTRRRLPTAQLVCGDALSLPFACREFERVFAAHFYGHLEQQDRKRFLVEARRVAPELVIVDASQRHARDSEEWQERRLSDGSSWRVYKRYFTAQGLAAELGGGDVLFDGRWFVAVRA